MEVTGLGSESLRLCFVHLFPMELFPLVQAPKIGLMSWRRGTVPSSAQWPKLRRQCRFQSKRFL